MRREEGGNEFRQRCLGRGGGGAGGEGVGGGARGRERRGGGNRGREHLPLPGAQKHCPECSGRAGSGLGPVEAVRETTPGLVRAMGRVTKRACPVHRWEGHLTFVLWEQC